MHQCLRTPELLGEIFSCFDPSHDPLPDSDRRMYARRIKDLCCGVPKRGGSDLSKLLPAISQSIPGDMFPATRSLEWCRADFPSSYIPLFLNPGLAKIVLTGSDEHSPSLLRTVAARCRRLTSITISSERKELTGSISTLVRRSSFPETLSVCELNSEALKYIAELPYLLSLELQALPTALPLTPDAETSPSLVNLHISGALVLPTAHFFTWCRAISLTTISINLSFDHTDFDTSLRMTIAPFDVPGFERHAEGVQSPVPGAEVHPLLPFANLTFLLIGPCLGFDVDDDIVADMARAWPRIETLGLLFRTRATLRCLRSFASLPHLTSLKMMLDATTIPLPETGAVAFQHKALYAFDAWYSEVTSPADVAEFLCRLFPGLRLIRSALSDAYTEEDSYDGSASDSDMWEAVQDHIHLQLHRALNSAR